MTLLKDILTGIDGVSYDIGRIMAVASSATAIWLEVYAVMWKGQPFDMQSFGVGVGALAAGIGVMLNLKRTTEPTP